TLHGETWAELPAAQYGVEECANLRNVPRAASTASASAVTAVERPAHHRANGGFGNPWPASAPQGIGGLLRWGYERVIHPPSKDPPASGLPVARSSYAHPRATASSISATWVGHSTVLVQVGGINVLTDPVWSDRASPVAFAGPRRIVRPAITLDALPPLDIILLSHNHYDHLDVPTVRALGARHPRATWGVPLGLADFVRRRGARHIVELDWWQEASVGSASLACTPAQHFSARGIGDRNRTLWCSWALRAAGHAIFFGGDTAYHPEFARIRARCGPFALVLLPIGAYEPRWFMRSVHMNPEEAVRAYTELVPRAERSPSTPMVPIHWGTFRLTDEPLDEPPARLTVAWRAAGLSEDALWLLRHGETRAITVPE
ncbi:MAG TPA: MBL fold metallo-hydrolase, partial [Candidatus Limnocylindrales bacterium]|nr:MBL fold metallo-hydrolase [Candidatus Limnocylindrales bacterium]